MEDVIEKMSMPSLKLPELKGHTVIELTDVETGKVERLEHDNTVTDFANIFARWGILGTFYTATTGGGVNVITRVLLPLCTQVFGGLRLYDTAVQGSEYPRIDQAGLIGYAGNIRSDGLDLRRGDFNAEESGEITNGYKLVWDFPTSVANGTIASVCLTHQLGGFHGDKLSPSYMITGDVNATTNESANYRGFGLYMDTPNSGGSSAFTRAGASLRCAIELKWVNGNLEMIVAKLPDKDTLRICKDIYVFGTPSLGSSIFPSYQEEVIADIDISSIAHFTSNSYIPEVFNGEDGYYYTVLGSYNGKSGYTFCKINTSTWQISVINTTSSADAVHNNNYYWYSNGYYRSGSSRWVATENYFYISYNNKFYKVSKTNYAITEITMDNTYYSDGKLYKYGGNIRFYGGRYIFNPDTEETIDTGFTQITQGGSSAGNLLCAEGVVANVTSNAFMAGNSGWYGVIACNPCYHSTINNLATPITKTSSKTMKVIYTLTESA